MSQIVAKKVFGFASLGIADNLLEFTSQEGGDYRVSGYLAVVATGTPGQLGLAAEWQDDGQAQSYEGDFIPYTAKGYSTFCFPVHIVPSTTISLGLRTDSDAFPSGAQVDLVLIVESLSAPGL